MKTYFNRVYLFIMFTFVRFFCRFRPDMYSKRYTAEPSKVKSFIFFNEIDYFCAKTTRLFDGSKLRLEYDKNLEIVNEIKEDTIFLNLTDNLNSNVILGRSAINIAKNFGISKIIYRPHPRVAEGLSYLLDDLCNITLLQYSEKCHNPLACAHIISAVSSFVSQTKGYQGSVWISKEGSKTTFTSDQVDAFLKIANDHLDIKLC